MADANYAGALLAIEAMFEAEWLNDAGEPRTRVAKINKTPEQPWPPKSENGQLQAWLLLELVGAGADHPGFGKRGSQTYIYDGNVHLHVNVPVNEGTDSGFALAVAAGEIFRARKFYDESPGCYVRTWTPRVDGGGDGDDDGVWFRVTATIPFEYYHRG